MLTQISYEQEQLTKALKPRHVAWSASHGRRREKQKETSLPSSADFYIVVKHRWGANLKPSDDSMYTKSNSSFPLSLLHNGKKLLSEVFSNQFVSQWKGTIVFGLEIRGWGGGGQEEAQAGRPLQALLANDQTREQARALLPLRYLRHT